MAKSGVSLNWGGLDKALLGAARRLSERQLLMDGIGEMMVSSTLQRFEDEEGPDGKAWRPSIRATPSEDTRAPVRRGKDGRLLKGSGRKIKGRKGGKTLTDTARLRGSIEHRATGDEVTVGSVTGSNVEYARIHQMGGMAGRGKSVELPARPFLGASEQDVEDIREMIGDFLADALTGGGK